MQKREFIKVYKDAMFILNYLDKVENLRLETQVNKDKQKIVNRIVKRIQKLYNEVLSLKDAKAYSAYSEVPEKVSKMMIDDIEVLSFIVFDEEFCSPTFEILKSMKSDAKRVALKFANEFGFDIQLMLYGKFWYGGSSRLFSDYTDFIESLFNRKHRKFGIYSEINWLDKQILIYLSRYFDLNNSRASYRVDLAELGDFLHIKDTRIVFELFHGMFRRSGIKLQHIGFHGINIIGGLIFTEDDTESISFSFTDGFRYFIVDKDLLLEPYEE